MPTIRTAVPPDVPQLVELGARMHAESPRWSRLSFNGEKLAAFLLWTLEQKNWCTLVAEHEGRIRGVFVGMCCPHWCSDDLVAVDLALFINPEERGGITAARLLRAYMKWGEDMGCKMVQAGITTGVREQETARLYSALGMRPAGSIFEVR